MKIFYNNNNNRLRRLAVTQTPVEDHRVNNDITTVMENRRLEHEAREQTQVEVKIKRLI